MIINSHSPCGPSGRWQIHYFFAQKPFLFWAILTAEIMSVLHHSLISSNHFRLGRPLPLFPSPEADLFAGDELQASEKDRAENVMIVDLLRNDLSRVCRPDSVRVPDLCRLEIYQTVQHLVSVVTGRHCETGVLLSMC